MRSYQIYCTRNQNSRTLLDQTIDPDPIEQVLKVQLSTVLTPDVAASPSPGKKAPKFLHKFSHATRFITLQRSELILFQKKKPALSDKNTSFLPQNEGLVSSDVFQQVPS